ncbi:TetR/AcrR family transcriptional regulator [Actinoplanes couchii]|nr:TetR/AcrR family transcriptional regulator [Actinoplanes couchii]MDR6324380.1 AcrR family transcriptional regulator [Actinoplanes couchii]
MRARSDEQREERRRQILAAAAAMLVEMPVAKVTLNELSRRTCLAKSNVLRYFESREAVLLELLDTEMRDWLTQLETTSEPVAGTARERGDQLADVLVTSLTSRPTLCDLISVQAAVLEHNVSTEVALHYKRASRRTVERQARWVLRYLPELGDQDATRLVAMTTLITAAAWPWSRPSAAMLAAYAADPAVAAMRGEFTDLLRQSLHVTLSGLLARRDDLPVGTARIDTVHRDA